MADMIPIGPFAHLTGLTIKAFHIYDSMGLPRFGLSTREERAERGTVPSPPQLRARQ
jgi:hypothetical protein